MNKTFDRSNALKCLSFSTLLLLKININYIFTIAKNFLQIMKHAQLPNPNRITF